MNHPPAPFSSTEDIFGTVSLETLKNRALKILDDNEAMTTHQKVRTQREIEFLLECERFNRLRRLVYQLHDEKQDRTYKRILNHQTFLHQLQVGRKETALAISKIEREIVKCKLDVIERARSLMPKRELHEHMKKLQDDFRKLRIHQKYQRARQGMLSQEIAEQAIRRAQFIRRIRKHFPDLEDELLESYDKQVFQQRTRR